MGETAVTREEVRKLIGGYATGTLTEAERKLLFAAALEDQELFDELAGEQVFKDLLDAPGVRARLLTSVTPAPEPEHRRRSWWAWGAVAAAAAAGLVLFIATRPAPELPIEIAAVQQEPAPAPQPAAPPAQPVSPTPPAALERRNEAPVQQGRQEAAVPEERQRVADPVAAAKAPAADAALEKAEVAVQGAPAVAQATGGKGGAAGARTAANAEAALLRNEAADVAAPFSFAYRREADSLRIVPAAQGFLFVSAGGQSLFPQNAVLAGSNVIVPLPAGTGDVMIVFAASVGAPSAEAVRREATSGTVTDPNPSPNSRLAIIVPALP